MLLRIMEKETRNVVEIHDVCRCSNLSSNFEIDYLYYETVYDARGKGQCVEMNKILCFEIIDGNV